MSCFQLCVTHVAERLQGHLQFLQPYCTPPWPGLGFALTQHPLIEKISAEVPGLSLNAWYLDDGVLVGQPEDLAVVVRVVEQEGPALGLQQVSGLYSFTC